MTTQEKTIALGGRPMTKEEERKIFGDPKRILFPKKYRKGLHGVAIYSVHELREEHPEWRLKDILADLIKNSNPDMPPAFLLEFAQHIIASWEQFELKKSEKPALELEFA